MASTYNKEWNNLSIEEKRDVIRVALKNGIRELPDIKAKYNEFAGGGSFYQRHRARWNNYLLRHGVPEQQAAKLSTFFAAQDALESGHGTSDAAKGKNNFGGMQYLDKKSNKMVNISYPSVDAYMDAKWKMMQNRFGRALNANSIQEYSNLLNDPRYHGKGYMYALYEGYRDGKPLDVAKQTQHMNNYTKILMDIAGEKGFKGAPVPAGQAGEAPASIARPENPYTQYTPAEPFFNQNRTFVRPEDVRKAQEENALKMAESQNAAMQQERKQSVDSFNTLMGLLHTPNNGNSSILGTIATLASLNKNNRFDTGGFKQQPRQYIYDVLPSLFAKDGVKITVSSGFRPGAKTVEGKPSRHSLKQAADIVGDFKAIRRVLDDPNSYTSRWLLANGYGYLDETSATGTTKFWHDHKRDHSHYHIGMDSGIVSKYANMMNGRSQNPLPAQQNIVEQPVELAQTPDIPFTPSNPQAFFGVHPAQQQSVYDYVTTPTVEQPVYDPMAEEKNNALSNLSKFNAIMQLTSPSNNNNNSFLNTVGLLANMSAEGGKIHIKPENRGKFTALKKRTGHSATWFKEHGTPAQKKMATFALNSRHWKHGYGGHIYDGTTEDTQQMDIPYAGELPDITVMPRRIANKSWDKVQERWVGDMPTYYAVNPETGKEEMLREIGNGKYSTYDDKHVFDVLGAEAAKKQKEQWIKNGGNASDFDKVMLGTLGLGLAPIALPEIAAGVGTALTNPYVDAGLASYFGAHGLNHAINEGIDGWDDAAMTALEVAPLGRLVKPIYEGVVQPGIRLFNSPLTGKWTTVGNKQYRLSPNSLGANGSLLESRDVTPKITADNESVQNESIKDMFRRILSGNSDGIKTTEEMAEMGRKDLLDEISSPWYKERWKKATNGNDEQIDDLLSRMRTRITDVPMDYSKTTEQLSGKPGFATYGATVPREPYKFKLSDGTPVTDYNTGLDVQIASDRGVKARNTAYHELQHYLTNKATGTAPYPSLKFIANGPYEPLITPTSNGELLIGRGDAWQHFIMDQNEALLPERSFVYEEAIHSPQKLKKRFVEIGRTPEEADDLILKLKDEAQDMMDIQEERAHLKTWFTKDILPLLKNPNDASEIERVLAEHPDIMKNRPEKIKTLMESLRPGNIKDYAKYLAESLGIIPFIVNTNSKEK